MMWNYRLISTEPDEDGESYLTVAEVYYDEGGRIEAWTEACAPGGENAAEVMANLIQMSKDIVDKAVLVEREVDGVGVTLVNLEVK